MSYSNKKFSERKFSQMKFSQMKFSQMKFSERKAMVKPTYDELFPSLSGVKRDRVVPNDNNQYNVLRDYHKSVSSVNAANGATLSYKTMLNKESKITISESKFESGFDDLRSYIKPVSEKSSQINDYLLQRQSREIEYYYDDYDDVYYSD